jgi:hypothetical protein
MAKVLRKAVAQISATKACSSFNTLSIVGVELHWRNSSSFKWPTPVDPNCNILFDQLDKSCPHQEFFTQGNYQLPGGYHS